MPNYEPGVFPSGTRINTQACQAYRFYRRLKSLELPLARR